MAIDDGKTEVIALSTSGISLIIINLNSACCLRSAEAGAPGKDSPIRLIFLHGDWLTETGRETPAVGVSMPPLSEFSWSKLSHGITK